jgi:hypothetical protein
MGEVARGWFDPSANDGGTPARKDVFLLAGSFHSRRAIAEDALR